MKKILLKVFTVILAVCCLGLVACNQKPTKTNATLVDFVDSTVKVEYGMNYTFEEFVYDTNGDRYELTSSVTDSNGQKVTANEFFKAVDDEYIVVYKVNFNGGIKTKTVTVKVYSTPIVTLADRSEYTYSLGILPAELPTVTAVDGDYDFTESEIKKEVYFVGKFEVNKMTDYDGVSNEYLPQKAGTYYWKVSVTNQDGITNSQTLYFYVVTPTGSVDIIPEEGGESIFTYNKTDKVKNDGFVTNAQIPTTYKDLEGNDVEIDNKVGYTGNAYKFSNIPHDTYLRFNSNFSAKEYIAMAKRGDFDAIRFSFLITNYKNDAGEPAHKVNADETKTMSTTIINNDQGKPGDARSIISSAGYYGSSAAARSVAINKWHTYTVSVEEFVKTLGTGLQGIVIRTFYSVGSKNVCDFYLGEVKTIKLPKLPEVKDTDIMDFSADPTQTLFGYDYLPETQTVVTTVTDAQGTVIGTPTTETITPTFTIDDVNVRNVTTSVFAEDLPKKNINWYDASTDNDSGAVDIVGSCPDPNALKISATSRTTAYFVKLRYNKDQIKQMATAGGYEKIRITYMLDMQIETSGSKGWYWTKDSTNGILQVGGNKDKSYYNKWITLEFTIDEFIAFMGVTPDYVTAPKDTTETTVDQATGNITTVTTTTVRSWKNVPVSDDMLFLNSGFRPYTVNLYVSGISFVTPSAS